MIKGYTMGTKGIPNGGDLRTQMIQIKAYYIQGEPPKLW